MLPVLPKVTKLQQKNISSFGGIDRRNNAKENSFYSLCGVDNLDGSVLETGNDFLCVQAGFNIESNDIIYIENEEGLRDAYYLGEGGFYKNGKLLPFEVCKTSADLTWMNSYVKEMTFDDNGQCIWSGDYSDTKLIHYKDGIFAIPQMLYTDGKKTYTWDNIFAMSLKSDYVIVSGGVLKIKTFTSAVGKVLWERMKSGDEIQLYINGKKISGTAKFRGYEEGYGELTVQKEDGEDHSKTSLGIVSNNTLVFQLKNIPKFVDAVVVYNRMWGVSGNRVYASGLASPRSFGACDGTEADAWWADTEEGEGFIAIASLNGRVVAFKKNSTYEIYGTVNPYTIKDVSRSVGCVCRESVKEVNGVLFLLTGEGMSVYGGSKFININEALQSGETMVCGIGKGSKYYALIKGSVYKYDYYTGLWTNVTKMDLKGLVDIDFDVFGLTQDNCLIQFTGDKKEFLTYGKNVRQEWVVESTSVGAGDFYAEGINKLEMRFETAGKSEFAVEIARDGREFESCGKIKTGVGWQICTVPIGFVPCSTFRYRIRGTGKVRLRLISYCYRKGGRGDKYE